jgi:hypothetical protein
VAATAATATACAACRLPLTADSLLSLTVDVTGGKDQDGTEYFTFDAEICHRTCRLPSLTFTPGHSAPVDFTPQAARLIIDNRRAGSTTAALAFTYTPMLSFREPGGELTSALVTALLSQGFQLAMNPDYGDMLQQSTPAAADFTCTVTAAGLVSLQAGEATMYSEQLDPADPDDAAWLDEALTGTVFVISGDNITMTGSGLKLEAAARLGTLVTALVPVHAPAAGWPGKKSSTSHRADDSSGNG